MLKSVRVTQKMWLAGCLLIGSLVLPVGCGKQPEQVEDVPLKTSQPHSEIVATVNGEAILADALAKRLGRLVHQQQNAAPPDLYMLNSLRQHALAELIEKTLIAQKAQLCNIVVTQEDIERSVQRIQEEYHGVEIQEVLSEHGETYADWIDAQKEQILQNKLFDAEMSSMMTVIPEEIRQYYEQNQEKYQFPAQVRAGQILVYEEERAEKALQALRRGEAFARVAQTYSESADAQAGGDLGFFAKGVMPPEFDEVIFSLHLGEISDIVHTPYGYQIFILTERRDAHHVTFEEAKARIKHVILQQKRIMALDLWMRDLQQNAKIQLNHPVIKQVNYQ